MASLSGTARGRQLGPSSDTLMAIPSAHSGTVMINPDLAGAAAIEDRGGGREPLRSGVAVWSPIWAS